MQFDFSLMSNQQEAFFKARAKHIGFGGARGGGKSWAVREKAKMLCLNYSGIRVCIVRRTYPELTNNHIMYLRADCLGVAKYNDRDKQLTFLNGSIIFFKYCSNDADLLNFQGLEFDIVFFDEATQMSEYQLKAITACVRGTNSFPKRCYYTCNPDGQGLQYIKRIFIDKIYKDGEEPTDYDFIQAFAQDNKALMMAQPDYIKQLEALPDKLKEAWLYGNWNVFTGMYFSEFENHPERGMTNTHVIKPLPLEAVRNLNVYRSYDFGYSKPFSCGWYGINREGVMFRILELYGCTKEPNTGVKWTAEQQFSEIKKVEREHPYLKDKDIHGVADPAIWEASSGQSIYETALRHGVYFNKGDNKRIPGWMQCRYRLQFDDNGYPMFYVFENCKQFVRTIPTLLFDETRVEDINTEGEDHIADEWRYMCMSRPIKPKLSKEEIAPQADPLNMIYGGNNGRN